MNFDIFDSKIYRDISSTKFGASFIAGFTIGFLLKKSIKLMFFILIVAIIAFFWLDSSKIAEIKNINFSNSLNNISELFKMFVSFIDSKISYIDQTSGFGLIAGFLLGLKFG